MNTLHLKISLGLTALAIIVTCLGMGGSNDATARGVNEYEGQHVAKINEYEGQHLELSGDPSQWG